MVCIGRHVDILPALSLMLAGLETGKDGEDVNFHLWLFAYVHCPWTMDDGRWTTILPEMVTVNRFARTVFDHSRDCPHHSRKARSSLFIIRTRMASTLAMPSKMNELDLPIISVISSKLTRDNKK